MESDTHLWEGGCLCGEVRYAAAGPATNRCFCHCHSCRRAVGAPSVPWATFARARLSITRGALREHRSSPPVLRGFCASCGTSLTYRHEGRAGEIDVAIATLDTPAELAPQRHIFVQDKLDWVGIDDGLPQHEQVAADASMSRARAVRPGYAAVSARIVTADVEGLVAFIAQLIEASGDYVPGRPAELRVGDSTILVSPAELRQPTSAFLYVYVDDVDAAHTRGLALGARSVEVPTETPYGDRRCMLEDRWGNTWQLASYSVAASRS